MLSYQHAYHAGGPADIIKHVLLHAMLTQLVQKPKALTYYETHAGRGLYPLDGTEITKTPEYQHGLSRLLQAQHPDPLLEPFIQQLKANPDVYMGSPAWAASLTRPIDSLHLCELHPQEVKDLRQFAKTDRRIVVHAANGHAHVPTLLPPPTARGMVLIDPPYEIKDEYLQTVDTIQSILTAWPKAPIMVWYPLLQAKRHIPMVNAIAQLRVSGTFQAEFTYAPQHPGMQGSGQIFLNLPFELDAHLTELIYALKPILAQGHTPPSVTRFLVNPR